MIKKIYLFSVLFAVAGIILATNPPKKKSCPIPIDLALVLDSSGSIDDNEWNAIKQFAKKMVDAFTVSDTGSHIAVITFSTNSHVEVKFNKYTGANLNGANIKRDIDNLIRRKKKGLTFIDKALKMANEDIFKISAGMRTNVRQFCLVLTDGMQTKDQGPFTPLTDASKPLKDKGVDMFALGIGPKVDNNELVQIADSSKNVYQASRFADLTKKIKELQEAQCKGPCTIPIDLALVLDSSGSIDDNEWNDVKQFAKKMVDAFTVSDTGSHIAIITFSTNSHVEVKFNKYTGANLNGANIKRDIDNLIRRKKKGLTFIDKALKMANEDIFKASAGMRTNVFRACLVMTDGQQTTDQGPYTALDTASQPLKTKGVHVLSLGIGQDVSQNELQNIASDSSSVFNTQSFENLPLKIRALRNKLCKRALVPPEDESVSTLA